jgi:hypothetical protein
MIELKRGERAIVWWGGINGTGQFSTSIHNGSENDT